MIRLASPSDLPSVMGIAAEIGLFDASQLRELEKLLGAYFIASEDKGLWVISNDLDVVGVAYCERERMTSGTWNLCWIAIAPEHRRQGYGAALLKYVERALEDLRGHQLLIETSASLIDAQAFYRNCGYQEEGRVRDFYEVGSDQLIFRKRLSQKHEAASRHGIAASMVMIPSASTVLIAPAHSHQVDEVAQLLIHQLESHGLVVNPQRTLRVVKRIITDPEWGFILAATDRGGGIVGVALCSSFWGVEHGGQSGWLEELFVTPNHRNSGVGTRLLSEAIRVARERGWNALDLEVEVDHSRVIGLYLRNGFKGLTRSRMVLRLRE